ncbi:hypothetical protein GCM10010177_73960 [Actinomadura citrea]|nr:hypothetical protein GCM10010177_73960 [Actinomadura citrea]
MAAGLPLVPAVPAWSHGYTTSPPSRSYLCGTHQVRDCGQVQWDPDGVEGPKGFPQREPGDGRICAGADGRWAPLDDQRGGTGWPATRVTAGTCCSPCGTSATPATPSASAPTWTSADPREAGRCCHRVTPPDTVLS